MKQIFVLAEHRQGQLREITLEMLTKGRDLAKNINAELIALLLGNDVNDHAKVLSEYANKVILIEDRQLEFFNSDAYQQILSKLIVENKPILTLIGHTSYGVDLAPSLAVSLKIPLATDCIDLDINNDLVTVTRQIYGGKVNVNGVLKNSDSYLITVRQATFQANKASSIKGEIVRTPSPLTTKIQNKQFIEYILPPPGGLDITAAGVLIGVGRGIKDASEIPQMEDLAKALRGALACSRPIVDKGWLPDNRQVGSSGKTVKPKLYIALGISGAFQHVLGMKNSDLIIAVNKDSNAPIFSVADYGVIEDLFKIVPALKDKIVELKVKP